MLCEKKKKRNRREVHIPIEGFQKVKSQVTVSNTRNGWTVLELPYQIQAVRLAVSNKSDVLGGCCIKYKHWQQVMMLVGDGRKCGN